MKYIIIQMTDSGHLRKMLFDDYDEAHEYLEKNPNQAYLISTNDEKVRIEDHT